MRLCEAHRRGNGVWITPTRELVAELQNPGTSEVPQTMAYLHKDLSPLMNFSLLLSVLCTRFPKRILLRKRVQGHANSIGMKGLNHFDSPLLLIKEKTARGKWISDHEALTANIFLKWFANAAKLCRLGPSTPDTWVDLVPSDSPVTLTMLWIALCLGFCETDKSLTSYSVLLHIIFQAPKQHYNLRCKPNLQQCLLQISSNAKRNQQDEADWIQSGLWSGENMLLGISEKQPPAFLLRNLLLE